MVKHLPTTRETQFQSLGGEDLEKEMATHSSILARRVLWTEESGGLYSPWSCKESDMTQRLNNHHHHHHQGLGICVLINSAGDAQAGS